MYSRFKLSSLTESYSSSCFQPIILAIVIEGTKYQGDIPHSQIQAKLHAGNVQ